MISIWSGYSSDVSWIAGYAIIAFLIVSLVFYLRKMLKEACLGILKKWNNLPPPIRFIIAIISSIAFAFGIMFIYKFHGWFDIIFLSKKVKSEGLSLEALSNIRRNIWLLGFAVFGGCLAIWARLAHEKQLKYTREQLKNSAEINRNDRFAKAAEMLDNIENKISSRGGLYILQDLILESPKAEYIRCVEIISYWILEHKKKEIDNYLLNIVAKISKIRSDHKELENIIEYYKDENDLHYWPYLDSVDLYDGFLPNANLQGANLYDADLRKLKFNDANLQGVYLRKADLSDADLRNVNLDSANLTEAKMASAQNLTKEQILSAMWKDDYGKGKPPELPDDLMNDPDIKVWLNNPDDKEA